MAQDLEMDERVLLVQIPPDLNAIKKVDLGIARGWRESTRDIFETYFKRGYVVTGFARSFEAQMPNIYKMERITLPTTSDFSSWETGVRASNYSTSIVPKLKCKLSQTKVWERVYPSVALFPRSSFKIL
jgi:hypothetical protein